MTSSWRNYIKQETLTYEHSTLQSCRMRKLKNSIETKRDNTDSDVIQQEFSKSGQKKGISPFAGERSKIF